MITTQEQSRDTPGAATGAPRVSVVIPTYNRRDTIGRAVRSVLGQTMGDLELLVVADGSPPASIAAIESFDDPRIRLIRHERNRGLIAARNSGLERARGEWVAFLDDDDEWLPEKLERLLGRVDAERDPRVTAAYSACYVQLPNGERRSRVRERPEGDLVEPMLRYQVPLTPTVYMVRRDVLREVGGFRQEAWGAEDLDCWLRVSLAGYRFAVVSAPLAVWYADREDQATKDPVALVRAFRNTDRLWGRLMRERLGAEEYAGWVASRNKRLRRRHKDLVKRIVRSGRRGDGLRYAWMMAPSLPWGAKYVAQALAFALVGRTAYRSARRGMQALSSG